MLPRSPRGGATTGGRVAGGEVRGGWTRGVSAAGGVGLRGLGVTPVAGGVTGTAGGCRRSYRSMSRLRRGPFPGLVVPGDGMGLGVGDTRAGGGA